VLDTGSKNIEIAVKEKDKAIQQLRQSDLQKDKQIQELIKFQKEMEAMLREPDKFIAIIQEGMRAGGHNNARTNA
jgi:hypothetical protein